MGKPRNTQKYPTYPEIPKIPGNTRKKKRYPEIPDHIFRHSYPTRTRPATRYFVQYPTRPDTEKPYPLGTDLETRPNEQQSDIVYMLQAEIFLGCIGWQGSRAICAILFTYSLLRPLRKFTNLISFLPSRSEWLDFN